MTNENVQAIIDAAEAAVADLRAGAADAVRRGLEAIVALGDRAQAAIDEDEASRGANANAKPKRPRPKPKPKRPSTRSSGPTRTRRSRSLTTTTTTTRVDVIASIAGTDWLWVVVAFLAGIAVTFLVGRYR